LQKTKTVRRGLGSALGFDDYKFAVKGNECWIALPLNFCQIIDVHYASTLFPAGYTVQWKNASSNLPVFHFLATLYH